MTSRRLSALSAHLTPKTLGLTVLAVALTAAMTAMGLWQLDSYNQSQDLDAAATSQAAPVPLDTLLGPDQAFTADAHARQVSAEGEYADHQVLVDRGSKPPWLVTPLVTDTGSAILVVRGLADRGSSTAARPVPPDGHVRVVGSLQPSEVRGNDDDLGDDVVPTLSTAQLISDFGSDLYSGFVVLTEQTPPSTLPAASPPQPDASLTAGLRNLMYAVQWWVFAAFVVYMWWRMVREQPRVA